MTGTEIVDASPMTRSEFFDRHASPGLVGLAGGSHWIDRSIRRRERRIRADGKPSEWSHAFLFGERRLDGHQWILESDLDLHKKHIRLGVQENRVDKYCDRELYPNVAVLDFGLPDDLVKIVVTEALTLLSRQTRYSLREVAGTLFAMRKPTLRARENLLCREGALYCSAFVQHCYLAAGVDFAEGVATKNTTPEDIAASARPHRLFRHVDNPC